MKPEEEDKDTAEAPVTGDVIGDTAYSERFVLKILLKLANLDTLKDEIQEKSFTDDFCLLWDMTAERDVVLFLQKHDVLNLFNFALPVIESPRLIEIIIGIIGNMCCQKEVVSALLQMDNFCAFLLENIKTDDSFILIQVLRLVNSALFLANDQDISVWVEMFKSIEYSKALYFMLQNSNNKELLETAMENLNTICSYCNTESCRLDFFTHFVIPEAVDSLTSAFTEITGNSRNHSDVNDIEKLERILVISLQITLNLVGFDTSAEIFSESKKNVITMCSYVLSYYENKIANQKEVDSDLGDVIDSTNTIIKALKLNEICDPDSYVLQSYNVWKALRLVMKSDKNGVPNFEEDDKEELQEFSIKIKTPLSTIICSYIEDCSETNLAKVLEMIGADYKDILGSINNQETLSQVTSRVVSYRTRLKNDSK